MDEIYPKWLFNILINDFDDDYWYDLNTKNAEFEEAFLKLRSLKRRYSNINKWKEAVAIYDEYIDVIIDYNGGELAIQSMFNADEIPEGWVPRPKLKSKKNRRLLSIGCSEAKYTSEDIAKINEVAFKETEGRKFVDIENCLGTIKGSLKKVVESTIEHTESKERIRHMHRAMEAFDVLSSYYKDKEVEEESSAKTLSEIFMESVNEEVEKARYDGREPVYNVGTGDYVFKSNVIVNKASSAALDYTKEFYNKGIIAFDVDSMPKEKARIYRHEFGSDLSYKSKKKQEKEIKKYEKEMKRREESNMNLAMALVRRQNGEIDLTDEKFTLNDYRKKYRKDDD